MQREASAYLRDVIEACDAIDSVLAGLDFGEYWATRMLRSSVERELPIIGEAIAVLSRTEPQLFAYTTNGRRIEDRTGPATSLRHRHRCLVAHVDDEVGVGGHWQW